MILNFINIYCQSRQFLFSHKDKLNKIYIKKLNKIKGKSKSSKVRFKIMDILGE